MILCIILYAAILAVSIFFAIEEQEGLYAFLGVLLGALAVFVVGVAIHLAAPTYLVSETHIPLTEYNEDLLFKNSQDQAMSVSGTLFKRMVYSSEVEKPYVLEAKKESGKTWYRIGREEVDYILYLPKR